MTKKQIDKLVQDELSEMIQNNPAKMCQHLLIQMGKLMVEANAATMDMKTECTIAGQRYEITAKMKSKKVK